MSSLFNLINIPFSYVIRFFYSLTNNYMLALLGFAIVVKIVLFPLGIKSQKNMVKQAALRPREMAIRNKYAGRNDQKTQQKCQQEVMELYQSENYNVASGCLPMIIQLLVIMAIYQIVYGPLTYLCSMSADCLNYVKEAVMYLKDTTVALDAIPKFIGNEIQLLSQINESGVSAVLEAMQTIGRAGADQIAEATRILGDLPDLTFFGADLSQTPTVALNVLILIPILNLVSTWGTTKITRKLSYQAPQQQADSSMKIMEYAMPLMIFYMAFRLPAALGLYWIFQNLLGIVQQFILSKMYPYPTFTEEELKAAEKELSGKAKREAPAKASSGEKKEVRSLHHIDDEDYEPAKKNGGAKKSAPTRYDVEDEPEAKPAEETPDSNSGIEKAPLKK
ncbi:MAG: YidC/Oxa1 family membrane protein insertase [Clostridia bacterium]|nr:YidC/Oxa1 family membrane protein insertase [Clostridia bacterium]